MSLLLCGKPLLLWNTPAPLTQAVVPPGAANHICMFGGKDYGRNLAQHLRTLHSENGLYCRLKQYSAMYHDYLLDSRADKDELIPAGCVELFCNGLHVVKDAQTLPILHTMLQHVVPLRVIDRVLCSDVRSDVSSDVCSDVRSDISSDVHSDVRSDVRSDMNQENKETQEGGNSGGAKESAKEEQAARHKDFLIHCGVTDFDASFSTAAAQPNPFSPRGSHTLHASLQSLDLLFYTNANCPCCRANTAQLLLNFSVDSFSFAQSGRARRD